jgi:hypothetical protein
MGRLLLVGLAGAVRRWPIVILLWAIGALFGLAFSLAAGRWLTLALQSSLLTRALLKNIDANVVIDLWIHHRDSLAMLGGVGVVVGLAQLALSIWLNAGVAGTAEDALAPVALREFWRRGFDLFPAFARLWLLAVGMEAAAVTGAALAADAGMRAVAESTTEMSYYYVLGSAGALGALLLVVLVAVHDHARLYVARTDCGAWLAYRWALRLVLGGDVRAPLLAFVLLLFGSCVWLVYQTVGMLLPATSAFGLTASLVWGQAFLQIRSLLRVTAFVAQCELQGEQPE